METIFTSERLEVLHLEMAVEEKVVVSKSCKRDLVSSKKELHKYLVLMLSAKESRLYLGNPTTFVGILTNTPKCVYACNDQVPLSVAKISDMFEGKEGIRNKFFAHIENSLEIILDAYRMPLFVLGNERNLAHFKKFTQHAAFVTKYVPGNYEEATVSELKEFLEPHIDDWKNEQEKGLLNQLENAAMKRNSQLV